MTTPHFYLADKSLIEAVDGMSEPEIAKHETSLDVEPITGATMAAHKRIQVLFFIFCIKCRVQTMKVINFDNHGKAYCD